MEEIKKKIQIVVARYNEDIKWLLPFKDVTIIYNKGQYLPLLNSFNFINLDNVGRESHTYLYHIIENYDNLSDKTIFFQGNIRDHKILNIEKYFGTENFIGNFSKINIEQLKKNIEHYGKWQIEYKNNKMKKNNYTVFDWLTKIIGIEINNEMDEFNVVWGANFAISKELILSKPKRFYENIIRYLNYHINPEEGHYLERTWYLIFNNNFIIKNVIGYISKYNLKDINDINDIYIENNKYKEIHLWVPMTNYEYGMYKKIYYTPNSNKYFVINPIIEENNFNISIKSFNTVYILIEFNDNCIYEIILGAFNNTKNIVRDYIKNKIIILNELKILNDTFIKLNFIISSNIEIYNEDKLIFKFNNLSENKNIKKIKIKGNSYWEYPYTDLNENIKLFICNNIYEDNSLFYKNNYLDYYIEKIENIYNIEENSSNLRI